MAVSPFGGYDTNLQIILSLRRDYILPMVLGKKEDGTQWDIDDVFPDGTQIWLRFYKNMADLKANIEIVAVPVELLRDQNGLLIRIEADIADTIPNKAEVRLQVDYPSGFPNGDNLPWAKTQVVRDD